MILSGNPSTGARIENCIPKAIKVLLVAAAVIAADARKWVGCGKGLIKGLYAKRRRMWLNHQSGGRS
jgi:hypothetical protein